MFKRRGIQIYRLLFKDVSITSDCRPVDGRTTYVELKDLTRNSA